MIFAQKQTDNSIIYFYNCAFLVVVCTRYPPTILSLSSRCG